MKTKDLGQALRDWSWVNAGKTTASNYIDRAGKALKDGTVPTIKDLEDSLAHLKHARGGQIHLGRKPLSAAEKRSLTSTIKATEKYLHSRYFR